MSRTGLVGPFSLAGMLHAAVLVVPIYFADPPEPEPAIEVQIRMPEPEPPPPPPEPEPEVEPPPPDPPPPPPEPEPEPKPKPKPKPKKKQEAKDETPPPQAPPEPANEPPPPEPPAVAAVTSVDNAPVDAPVVPAAPPPRPKKPVGPPPDMGGYGRGVHGSLMRNRRYPAAARRLGMEGTTKVKFTVDRRGRLVGEPIVVRSCGHDLLDTEALRMVRDSAPFAPLPENFPKKTATLTLPLKFSLDP